MSNAEQIPDSVIAESLVATAKTQMVSLFERQKMAFDKDRFPRYEQRVRELKQLKQAILINKQDLLNALETDFGYRSHDESMLGDIFSSISSVDYTLKHLQRWMKPQKRAVGIVFQPAHAKVVYQPKGVVGIIAPWNYPVFLTIGPLVAALAAGNRAMIKMSEYTPNTNAVLVKLLAGIFDSSKVGVTLGEAEVAQAFSGLPFDHLLFTGSTEVGRHVMRAAAENLVPVTLELGGKSPVIIDDKIPLGEAVKRFIYGKTMNAGQTCVSPDYVYCPKSRVNELVAAIRLRHESMYPSLDGFSKRTRIINRRQHGRLVGYLEQAKSLGAEVIPLGEVPTDQDECYMPLTLIIGSDRTMTVMQEEIFGPILPIIGYDDLSQVIDSINANSRPLGLYIQSFDKHFQNTVLNNTHAGGVCINDAAFHVVVDDLPFGGTGDSGLGSYHGVEGFRTFSHAKSVFSRGRLFFADMLFPPYGTRLHQWFYRFFVR
ncbi:coniferyl-aldehyde dehydrogenase [Enterovibrio norvegicus FF-33]|uniref:coniferyl aldehyde dehydrogenase n=1 Tax=Enterovibrio norvegicus TaxID=188144 RepID=UPI0003063DEE|nr:coniferyl aldehyde dehydrogenase [Enterovibrio norvegicus]OEE65725.1 coniferyl-aldehyde dehydrogenase [Enterovibrio norvegicus FF-33]